MPDILIRAPLPGETALVARFVHALLDELSDGAAPPLAEIVATAEAVLAKPTVTALVAFVGTEPVGAIVLNGCAAIYAGGDFGEITELYVLPAWRSHGAAARLVAEALVVAQTHGWKRLEVGAPNQPDWARTVRFYLREGFAEVGPRLRRLV